MSIVAETRRPAREGVNRWQWHDPRWVDVYDGGRPTGDDGYPTTGVVGVGHVVARDTTRGTLLVRLDQFHLDAHDGNRWTYWEASRLSEKAVAIIRRCPWR